MGVLELTHNRHFFFMILACIQ